jgi:hypothetical protein
VALIVGVVGGVLFLLAVAIVVAAVVYRLKNPYAKAFNSENHETGYQRM